MSTAYEVKTGKAIIGQYYNVPTASKVAEIAPEGEPKNFPDIISFSYFESVYDSFVSAVIEVFDSTGELDKAFDNCGIRPFCPVEIIITDPSDGTNFAREKTKLEFTGDKCFYVRRIVDQITQQKKQIYRVELTNRDGLVAMSRTVISAWPPDKSKGVDFNLVVQDILQKYIKTPKTDFSQITSEMSEAVDKVMGNNRKPYQLLNYICSKASPKASTSGGKEETRPAGYLFFETYDKYRFNSIYKLITDPGDVDAEKVYKFSFVNDSKTTPIEAAYTILSYKFYDGKDQTDIYEEIASKKRGKPPLTVLDVQRNTFKKIEKLPPETLQDKCLKVAADEDFVPRTYTMETEYQIEYYNTCDENALDNQPTNPELTSLNYGALLDMLKSKTSQLRIPGNLGISAGDHIILSIPVIKGEGESSTETSDKYSGFYLVTTVAHRVEGIKNVYTDLEVCKIIEA
jgi:hypothetical protein